MLKQYCDIMVNVERLVQGRGCMKRAGYSLHPYGSCPVAREANIRGINPVSQPLGLGRAHVNDRLRARGSAART